MLLRRSAQILRASTRTSSQLLRGAGDPRILSSSSLIVPPITTAIRAASTGQPFHFDTLVDMQQKSCFTYGDRPFLGFKPIEGGGYKWVTYRQFGDMVDRCRAAMKQSGVGPGDKVAVISSNRVEWAVGAYSAFSLRAAYVPMYEQQRLKECEYILKDSGAKLLLVSKETIYDKTLPFKASLPTLEDVWCFDLDFHARLNAQNDAAQTVVQHPRPDDVATLIYTSGTTGVPKGVKLTHRNLVADIQAMNEVVTHDALKEVRSLSFLPWAHCIGKNCELHNMLQRGGQVALAQSMETIADNIREVQPTILFAVPTLYKRVYDKMTAKIAEGGLLARALVSTALSIAERRREVLSSGRQPSRFLEMQYALAEKTIIRKLRAPLGGMLQISPVGGSAMNVEVARFFENIGVAIMEGYGLTETSPLLTINGFQPWDRSMGSVGRPVPGAEVAIVATQDEGTHVPLTQEGQEGEIWAAGPMVFDGYHNKPEDTAQAFGLINGKRYFRTGDLGMFIKGGFLKITGRVKELYKLENGKYVAPAVVEKALLEHPIVAQVLLHGANRPYNVALIYPSWDKLKALAIERKVLGVHAHSTVADLKLNDNVQALMSEVIMMACKDKVKKYEMPAGFLLLTEPFTVENDMLTQKLSVKRHNVVKAYTTAIEQLYSIPLTSTKRRPATAPHDHHDTMAPRPLPA